MATNDMARPIVTAGLVLLAGLPLGGCTNLQDDVRQFSKTVAGEVDDLSARLTPPAPPAHHTPTHTATRTPPATVPPPAPPPIHIDGLSATAVRALLGEPATRTAAAPGENWIYRDGGCELRLYLFPDVASGGLHVLDHRIADPTAGADPQACLHRLHDDHTG